MRAQVAQCLLTLAGSQRAFFQADHLCVPAAQASAFLLPRPLCSCYHCESPLSISPPYRHSCRLHNSPPTIPAVFCTVCKSSCHTSMPRTFLMCHLASKAACRSAQRGDALAHPRPQKADPSTRRLLAPLPGRAPGQNTRFTLQLLWLQPA